MKTLRSVTCTKRIKVDTGRGYTIRISGLNTSLFRVSYNDYYHDICEVTFTSRHKYMNEFYDSEQKSLFDISSWFGIGRCWMSKYINTISLSNLEDD